MYVSMSVCSSVLQRVVCVAIRKVSKRHVSVSILICLLLCLSIWASMCFVVRAWSRERDRHGDREKELAYVSQRRIRVQVKTCIIVT